MTLLGIRSPLQAPLDRSAQESGRPKPALPGVPTRVRRFHDGIAELISFRSEELTGQLLPSPEISGPGIREFSLSSVTCSYLWRQKIDCKNGPRDYQLIPRIDFEIRILTPYILRFSLL